MKTKILTLGLFAALQFAAAQTGGGEFKFESTECLSPEARASIQKMIQTNQKKLVQEGKLASKNALLAPLFIWPVKKSTNAPYNEVWSISNYVDHNSAYPNQVQDYNCGTRTYDTAGGYNHAGIDIFTWPFGWYQMDHNEAEVIAAAPGVIVAKGNGQYDRNCAFNNLTWNAVYVQHSDGSIAWYGHLKNNSLTSKSIGQSVNAGEYLGVVGSSGNSTGPHLHFEVYNSNSQLVDPYQGPCNTWTSATQSWWQVQKNYNNPKINSVSSHSGEVILNNGCGVQESTLFKSQFSTGEGVYIYTFLSDIATGSPVNIQLFRPDNSVAYNQTFNMPQFYSASYWYWNFIPATFNQTGNWKAQITAGGFTQMHTFSYGVLATAEHAPKGSHIKILNPVRNQELQIEYQGKSSQEFTMEIYSMEGKLVKSGKVFLREGVNRLTFAAPKGNYIVMISSDSFEESFKILNY